MVLTTSLENLNDRLFAMEDPIGFLDQYPERAIFDEAQQSPQLFSIVGSALLNGVK